MQLLMLIATGISKEKYVHLKWSGITKPARIYNVREDERKKSIWANWPKGFYLSEPNVSGLS